MRRFRRTTLITVFCLAILAGLGLSRKLNFEPGLWLLLLLPGLLLLKRKNPLALIVIVLFGLSLGLLRGGIYMDKLEQINSITGQKVTIQATATSDSIYGRGAQMEFTAKNLQIIDTNQKLTGNIKISGFGVPMVYRGDRVQAEGKIYPMRGSNQMRMSYAQLATASKDNNMVNGLTRGFAAGMKNALPEPNSSFGLGILIGQRNTLPAELVEALTIVGLVHIVAVSGYNVTILARAVARLRLGSKYQRLMLSLGLITLFILVTGFSASIVRAGIVAGLSLIAWYYGRRIGGVVLIACTAALTGMVNPFYIWSDLGWYLSFLAFFGVLVIAPLLASRLFKSSPGMLAIILIETLCAELMTLPLIMMSFSQLSIVGLLANLLIVPLIPLAMLLTAAAATAGALIPQLAGWLAWPANTLLTFILDTVQFLARIPSASIKATIGPAVMACFYVLLLGVILILHRRTKIRNSILTDKII